MKSFEIQPENSWYTNPTTQTRQRGMFIKQSVNAFYHADYSGGGMWSQEGSIENMIWTLKNDVSPFPNRLPDVIKQLGNILSLDLPQILYQTNKTNLTICAIPRSKIESTYRKDQLLFKAAINDVANRLNGFYNGTNYIIRHTDTKTTHLTHGNDDRGGNGSLPYPGITKDTCTISNDVRGKDILLIDDLYTKSVNIDEDCIQALFDNGANSVVFYAIGKTVFRNS